MIAFFFSSNCCYCLRRLQLYRMQLSAFIAAFDGHNFAFVLTCFSADRDIISRGFFSFVLAVKLCCLSRFALTGLMTELLDDQHSELGHFRKENGEVLERVALLHGNVLEYGLFQIVGKGID